MKHKTTEEKKATYSLSLSPYEAAVVSIFAHKLCVSRSKYVRDAVFDRIEKDTFLLLNDKDPEYDQTLICLAEVAKKRLSESAAYDRVYLQKKYRDPKQHMLDDLKKMSLPELDMALDQLREVMKEKGESTDMNPT